MSSHTAVREDLRWDPPGPGSWELERVHYPAPVSRVVQDVLPGAAAEGWGSALARHGVPVAGVRLAFVNDRLYLQISPVEDETELAARDRAAAATFAGRAWRDDLRAWSESIEPAVIARNVALTAVDPAGLDDASLAAHLGDVVAHLHDALAAHFSLVPAADLAVGDYLARGAARGADPGTLLALLRGAAPAAAGQGELLEAVAAPLRAAGIVPGSLDEIRRCGPAAAHALDAYLAHRGSWLVGGYDVDHPTVSEVPSLTLLAVRHAVEGSQPGRPAGAATPPEDPSLAEALGEARLLYGLRDANEGPTVLWPLGLLRRALLEAVGRLLRRGALDDPGAILVLSAQEIAEGLRGGATADPDLLGLRLAVRGAARHADAPESLGPAGEAGGEPATAMPPNAARAMAAMAAAAELEWSPGGGPTGDGAVTGAGIGSGTRTGRAVVVTDAVDAFARLEPGDILVAVTTNNSFNAALPLTAGLVVEEGGLYTHAAIMARELDLPAVVGARSATAVIPDGATVELDADTGVVRVVG